jgi:predicted nucleotidyltransferase
MISRREILDLSARIAREFSPHAIILFGSYAYGKPTRDSDVDLLIVKPLRMRPLRAAVQILCKVNPRLGVDLIIQSPKELARRYREFDPLAREAIDRGEVLYERDGTGVVEQIGRRLRRRSHANARPKVPKLRRRLLSRTSVH